MKSLSNKYHEPQVKAIALYEIYFGCTSIVYSLLLGFLLLLAMGITGTYRENIWITLIYACGSLLLLISGKLLLKRHGFGLVLSIVSNLWFSFLYFYLVKLQSKCVSVLGGTQQVCPPGSEMFHTLAFGSVSVALAIGIITAAVALFLCGSFLWPLLRSKLGTE